VDTLGLRRVTPVGGETVSLDREPARSPVDATVPPQPTAAGNVAVEVPDSNASPTDEPLSRLAWPATTERIDPAQTLRDWAEGAGLVVAFGIVSLWIVRQYLAKRTQTGGPTKHMQLIESLWLPQRCRVHLVEAGGRQVLVTTDAAGVKCVTVLPDRFAALLDDDAGDAAPETVPLAGAVEPEQSRVWNALRESRLT
jgi:flagellar biogenesis protein FliO